MLTFAKFLVAKCKCKMDIVNRIKAFMAAGNISSTQFADACGIPRPTLSQILGGRNKKISDEVISKIHEAYPALSVMWLLFGEGEMTIARNTQFSEPQTPRDFPTFDSADSLFSDPDAAAVDGGDELIFGDDESTPVAESHNQPAGVPTVQIPADGSKSIVNIMVFYSDNSYQSFVPR